MLTEVSNFVVLPEEQFGKPATGFRSIGDHTTKASKPSIRAGRKAGRKLLGRSVFSPHEWISAATFSEFQFVEFCELRQLFFQRDIVCVSVGFWLLQVMLEQVNLMRRVPIDLCCKRTAP